MSESIIRWLDHLRVLLPPQSALLVGAGAGQGPWVRWLLQHGPAGSTTLVEADGRQFTLLQQLLAAERPAAPVQALNRVVAPEPGDTSYYVASLAAESGLLDPQALRPLWPNLQALQQQQRSATTLQDLLARGDADGAAEPPGGGHWLLLDCLPAAALLQSLQADTLRQIDVVLARVLLDEAADADASAAWAGAGLHELEHTLQTHDLRRLALQPTRHPAIAHALYARDARASLQGQAAASAARAQRQLEDLQVLDERLAAQVEALATQQQRLAQAAERQQALQAELAQERAATQSAGERLAAEAQARAGLQQQLAQAQGAQQGLQAELAQERAATQAAGERLAAEAQARAGLQQQLAQAQGAQQGLQAELERERTHAQALQARLDEQAKAQAALQQQLQQAAQARQALQTELEQARAQHVELAQKHEQQAQAQKALQAQLEQARHENAQLLQTQEQQAQLTTELEKARQAKEAETRAKAELQARFNILQAEQEETTQRQARIDEELARAEAQLKLLEELLLSEDPKQNAASPVAAEAGPVPRRARRPAAPAKPRPARGR